jgi:outer membrane receptor protein involved in Fe transport
VKGSWTRDITSSLNSTFVFGGQGFINKMNQNGSFASKFAGPGLEVVSAGIDPRVSEQYIKNVNAGYFAQEQLGWHDWTFLTVGGRYDKNSAFGESAGGVFYPKVSVSVVPSDRAGWSSSLFPTLRLRAAYGKSGRQPGAFDKFTTYQALPSEFGGGLVPSNLGNPELKPEVSTEWEVGAEAGLFSDKVGLNITYWNRMVNDALVAKQFPLSGGFRARQLANSGKLGAHGLEVGGTAFVINRPNVGIDIFANGAYLWQSVVSMGGAAPIKVGGAYPRYRNFLKEGYAPGALLGAKLMQPCSSYGNPTTDAKGGCLAAGQFPLDLNRDGKPDSDAELLNALRNPLNPTNLIPLIADDDGNGDKLDHYLGKPYPDWSGAIGGNVRIGKSWKIGTLFEYRAGNYTITDLTGAFRKSSASIGRNTPDAAALEAILLNPASTPDARLQAAKDWTNRIRTLNEPGLNQNESGNFMRWRELNFTYSVPTEWVGRMNARDVALTLGVRNLKLWTDYPGTDPESNVIGRGGAGIGDGSNLSNNYLDAVEMYGFPLARRFNFAVRVGF